MATLREILGMRKFPHYYGDVVRIFFFVAGLVMILSLPLFSDFLPVPLYISLFAILVLVFVAGLTNPAQKWTSFLDSIMSLIGFLIFEFYAVSSFSTSDDFSFFLINQTLAVLFLCAFYFAIKTTRGFVVKERKPKT